MTKVSTMIFLFSLCQFCGVTSAQSQADHSSDNLGQARIEAEQARMAARNRPGSQVPSLTPYAMPSTPASPPTSPPTTVVQPPPPLSLPRAAPSVITPCDAGGCFDSNAQRYNGRAGTYLNGAGKTCQQIGTSMQCF